MKATKTPFEPTSTWCYNFARYEALPEILQMPEVRSGDRFLLRDLTARVLDATLTEAQQNMSWIRPHNGEPYKVKWSVKFYVAYFVEQIGGCAKVGQGWYRKESEPEQSREALENIEAIEDEAIDDADTGVLGPGEDLGGWIYAFSFPMIRATSGPYPIKIGKTGGDVQKRVEVQCRSSASFELPVILGSWQVHRMSHMESAVHYVLKARGKWRETAPGQEWFDTTPQEIDEILRFVGP